MPSKRRKGKQGGSGRNTPASVVAPDAKTTSTTQPRQEQEPSATKAASEAQVDTEMKDASQDTATDKVQVTGKEDTDVGTEKNHENPNNEGPSLVLTSSAKRGVYECDYCHSDISQLPRIRCAVCSDFDLCLDCFVTTDHTAAMARIKAAATAQQELSKDGIISSSSLIPTLANTDHDETHGYHVCDSTRYPIFASGRMMDAAANKEAAVVAKEPARSSVTDDKMDVDNADTESKKSYAPSEATSTAENSDIASSATATATTIVLPDDPKVIWTAEEDLRLLDGILTHGLGNWTEISEAVGGNGSTGKTPKRCMERYFDDYLGRYGHILPPFIIVDDANAEEEDNSASTSAVAGAETTTTATAEGDKTTTTTSNSTSNNEEDEATRASKRRSSMPMRSPSGLSSVSRGGSSSRKKVKVVPTESLPGYENVWPEQYLPTKDVQIGQLVAREQSYKAELAFVKQTAAAPNKAEADKIRDEWIRTRMGQIGSPTVLPPRPEDTAEMPGADLAGFMPRRGDLDIEWDNDAEAAIADMEFSVGDLPQDKQLKVQVLQIYHRKQEEREKRKNFILRRELFDYRKMLKEEQSLPVDELDLVRRMRLFERLHTPEEHQKFLDDILKAKRLRKEIAKLQMYRRIGIKSLAEAEKYELDKSRRQFHKMAQAQKDAEAKAKTQAASASSATSTSKASVPVAAEPLIEGKDSLWKQYRNSDRKGRRSSSARLESGLGDVNTPPSKNERSEIESALSLSTDAGNLSNPKNDSDDMDIDQNEEKAKAEFKINHLKGYSLLTSKEIKLCLSLKVTPSQYLKIKGALIQAALAKGLLDEEGHGSVKRAIVQIDIEKRGEVIDFMIRSGWISSKIGDAARSIKLPSNE